MKKLTSKGPQPLIKPTEMNKIAQKCPIPPFFGIFFTLIQADTHVFYFRFQIYILQALKKCEKISVY